MINEKLFIKMIQTVENFENEVKKWSDFGIEIFEMPIGTLPWEIFNIWLDCHFDVNGKDWIEWYFWERKSLYDDRVLPCYDENGNTFYVNNPEDLWNIVKDYQIKSCTDIYNCPLKS